jgi:tartrate-resistant acid phosphatase type 5
MVTGPFMRKSRAGVSRTWQAVWVGLLALCGAVYCSVLLAAGRQVNILALGDWGAETKAEAEVARGMKNYVEGHDFKPDAVLLLGDNFYMTLSGGVKDARWQKMFEQMYDSNFLSTPFYAVLGNHDYSTNSARVELEYPKAHPNSRFKMPGRWYRVDLPPEHPMVTLIALDSDSDQLGRRRWAEQSKWLESQSAWQRAPWTICFAHHPLFSDSAHGDDGKLQKDCGPLFRKHHVDVYLAGHDHCLEYLEITGWPTSFVVSGAGGQRLYPIESHRAKFARSSYGFVRLEISTGTARVSLVDEQGKTLYTFQKNRQGQVSVVAVGR